MNDPQFAPDLWNRGDARMQASSAGFTYPVIEALAAFDYGHLPSHLQEVSKRFFQLAWSVAFLRGNEFQTVWALQHLLIAKDAAVRAENNA